MQLVDGAIAKRPARGRQQNPLDPYRIESGGKTRRHALEDRIVLAVDRQDLGPAGLGLGHEDRPRNHQRLFVGQQHAPPQPHRRQCRQHTGCTDDGRHHIGCVRVGGNRLQSSGTSHHLGRQARSPQRIGELARAVRIGHGGELRAMLATLREHARHITVCAQCYDAIPVAVPSHHVQGADADRAGRSQHRDTLHAPAPISATPSANTGAAANRLSIRSSTPPCPGNRLPLSLMPASRLSRLSHRSPPIEITRNEHAQRDQCRQRHIADQPTAAQQRGRRMRTEHGATGTGPGLAGTDVG